MELTQLKYFIRLAEILNFTEASRLLFITQSIRFHKVYDKRKENWEYSFLNVLERKSI